MDNVRSKEAKLTYLTFVWKFIGSSVDITMISSGSTPLYNQLDFHSIELKPFLSKTSSD